MRKKNTKKNKLNIVGLDFFCGAGGLTNGLKKSGVNVIAGFDNDPNVRYAYETNNRKSEFIEADITDIKFNIAKVKSKLKEVDYNYSVFAACAPCQPFSSQNKNYKNKDLRKSLLLSFIEMIEKLPSKYSPDFIFAENVGPMKNRGKKILKDIENKLIKMGYSLLPPKVHNASYFGVPQNRKRLIFLAAKNKLVENSSKFKWAYFENKYSDKENLISVKNAFSNYEKSSGKKLRKIKAGQSDKNDALHIARKLTKINIDRIKQIDKPGGSRSSWEKRLVLKCHKKYKGHTDVYGRMDWKLLAPTLTTKCNSISNGRYGHPEQDRAISLREAAILQTMGDYVFEEPIRQDMVAKQIGNAVPPLLAEKFGKYFIELAKGSK